MKIQEIKEGFGNLLDSVAEGWHHLRESAANALTRFKPGQQTQLPAREEIDDPLYLPARGWSMLGGEVFEDDTRLVVRLEMPGMDKQNIAIDVRDDALVVSGEKRFERESTEGRWRVMQCATAVSAALCHPPRRWTLTRPGRATGTACLGSICPRLRPANRSQSTSSSLDRKKLAPATPAGCAEAAANGTAAHGSMAGWVTDKNTLVRSPMQALDHQGGVPS